MFSYTDMDLSPLYKLSFTNFLIFPNKLNLTVNFLLRKLFIGRNWMKLLHLDFYGKTYLRENWSLETSPPQRSLLKWRRKKQCRLYKASRFFLIALLRQCLSTVSTNMITKRISKAQWVFPSKQKMVKGMQKACRS